jgi:hypothetical protein
LLISVYQDQHLENCKCVRLFADLKKYLTLPNWKLNCITKDLLLNLKWLLLWTLKVVVAMCYSLNLNGCWYELWTLLLLRTLYLLLLRYIYCICEILRSTVTKHRRFYILNWCPLCIIVWYLPYKSLLIIITVCELNCGWIGCCKNSSDKL